MDNGNLRKETADEAMHDAGKFTVDSISQQYNVIKDILK